MEKHQTYLIVDDDADDIEFFCEAIETLNVDVSCHSAANGEEALEWLRQKTDLLPDFIFLDFNMPKMNGMTCLAELKTDENLKHIPVIICSTSSHSTDRNDSMALGADYFLVKSTTFKKLCDDIVMATDAVREDRRFGVS